MDLIHSMGSPKEMGWFENRRIRRSSKNPRLIEQDINKSLSILHEMGLADKWVKNYCRQQDLPLSLDSIINHMFEHGIYGCNMIDISFTWSQTKEGQKFWSNANSVFYSAWNAKKKPSTYIEFDREFMAQFDDRVERAEEVLGGRARIDPARVGDVRFAVPSPI